MKSNLIKSWQVNSSYLRFPLPLSSILNWCINQRADRMLMVLRMERSHGRWKIANPSAELWLKNYLGKFIIEKFLAQGWPITLMSYDPACVFVLRFSDEVKDIILRKEPRLRNWVESLPEDFCLFRSGEVFPLFISITHENDAWFISKTRPRLKIKSLYEYNMSVNEPYNLKSKDCKYFCLPWAYGQKLHPKYKPSRRSWKGSLPPELR